MEESSMNIYGSVSEAGELGLRHMSFCQKNGIILLYHLLTIQKENDGSTRDIFSFTGLVLFFRSTFLSYCRDIEIFEAHTQVPKVGPDLLPIIKML